MTALMPQPDAPRTQSAPSSSVRACALRVEHLARTPPIPPYGRAARTRRPRTRTVRALQVRALSSVQSHIATPPVSRPAAAVASDPARPARTPHGPTSATSGQACATLESPQHRTIAAGPSGPKTPSSPRGNSSHYRLTYFNLSGCPLYARLRTPRTTP